MFVAHQLFLILCGYIALLLLSQLMDVVMLCTLSILLLWKSTEALKRSPSLDVASFYTKEKTNATYVSHKREKLKFVNCNGLRWFQKVNFD